MKKNSFLYTDVLIIMVLLFIGIFFRFYLINEIPCGLSPDQALNGLDAQRFLDGHLSPIIGGKEGLFIYLTSISQLIFGTGIWQIFIVSAIIGTATIVTTYLAVRKVFGRNIAFLSSFLLAVSGWHIVLSRNGYRAILVPFIISLFIYFLVQALNEKNYKWRKVYYILMAGIFALGFYTYLAYLIFAFSIFLSLIIYAIKKRGLIRQFIRKRKNELIYSLITFILIILPLSVSIVINFDQYAARVDQVSIFSEGETIYETIKLFGNNFWNAFVGIFYSQEYHNWRHNPPDNTLLHASLIPFFFISFIYALLKKRQLLILFALFFIMFLPAILTSEGAPPHGLRLIGIIPFLYIIPSIALSWFLNFSNKYAKILGILIVSSVLIAATVSGYKSYFQKAPSSINFYNAYRCDLTEASNFIKNHKNIKVISDDYSFETIRYLILPDTIEYELPAKFINDFNQQDAVDYENIIVVSSRAKFNQQLIDLLSKNFQKNAVENIFGSTSYYVFSN